VTTLQALIAFLEGIRRALHENHFPFGIAWAMTHPDRVDAVLDLVNDSEAIRRDAEILRPEDSLFSTICAADQGWFSERQITAHNIAGNVNPLASTLGLTQVVRMLADGTITARIRSTVELAGVRQMLEKLRNGGLRGKAVIACGACPRSSKRYFMKVEEVEE
jgi:hypothetical protein